MATNETFAERLTTLREIEGKKRQEVADSLGITRASLEYYEKGKRKPDIEVLAKLANYYKVSTDYLLGLSNVPTTDKDVQFVCEYTGLTQEAVGCLRNEKEILENSEKKELCSEFLETINKYIEDGNLFYIFAYASEYKKYLQQKNDIYDIILHQFTEINELNKIVEELGEIKDKADLCLFRLQELQTDFVKKMYDDTINHLNDLEKMTDKQMEKEIAICRIKSKKFF